MKISVFNISRTSSILLWFVTSFYLMSFSVANTSFQDDAMCGLVASTNIETLYTMWSCDTGGSVTSDPCIGSWTGTTCNGGFVRSIILSNITLSGT